MFFFFFFDKSNTPTKACGSLVSYLKEISKLPMEINLDNNENDNQNESQKAIEGFELYRHSIYENNEKNPLSKLKYYFRGQYSQDFDLLPSAFRNQHYKKEDFYYHHIKVECPHEFKGRDRLDQLVKMQHYDCPTRLLDITSNPLVALYFACKNFDKNNIRGKNNKGIVYVFAANENDILFNDSDRALMLSCLSKFNYNEKIILYNESMKLLKRKEKIEESNAVSVMKRFIYEVKTEKPSFDCKIDPLDLLKCFYVQPEKTNERILKQDGAFIISGLSKDAQEAKDKLESMIYKKIIITNKKKILEELDKIGINQVTLFPEIDKIADYLKNK